MNEVFSAIEAGDVEQLRLALGHPDSMDVNDEFDGEYPITFAARFDNSEIIELLVEHGADMSYLNSKNKSANDISLSKGHYSNVLSLTNLQSRPVASAPIEPAKLDENLIIRAGITRLLNKLKQDGPVAFIKGNMVNAYTDFMCVPPAAFKRGLLEVNDPESMLTKSIIELGNDKSKFHDFLSDFLGNKQECASLYEMAITLKALNPAFQYQWLNDYKKDYDAPVDLARASATLIIWSYDRQENKADIAAEAKNVYATYFKQFPMNIISRLPNEVGHMTSDAAELVNEIVKNYPPVLLKSIIGASLQDFARAKNSAYKFITFSALSAGSELPLRRMDAPLNLNVVNARKLIESSQAVALLKKYDFFNNIDWHKKFLSWGDCHAFSLLTEAGIKFKGDIQDFGNQLLGLTSHKDFFMDNSSLNEKEVLMYWAINNGYLINALSVSQVVNSVDSSINSKLTISEIKSKLDNIFVFLKMSDKDIDELNLVPLFNRIINFITPQSNPPGGLYDVMERIASYTAGINAVDHEGQSMLMSAAQNGNYMMVDKLIASKADIQQVSPDGMNALAYAANSKASEAYKSKTVSLLLAKFVRDKEAGLDSVQTRSMKFN